MQHDSGLVGDFAVREGSRVALLLLVEDAVLGQQQVEEQRRDCRPFGGKQTSQPPADSGSFSSTTFLTAFSSSVLTSSDSTTVAIAREALRPKELRTLSVLAAVSCRAANSRVFVGFGGAGAATTSQADARDTGYIEARTWRRASGL